MSPRSSGCPQANTGYGVLPRDTDREPRGLEYNQARPLAGPPQHLPWAGRLPVLRLCKQTHDHHTELLGSGGRGGDLSPLGCLPKAVKLTHGQSRPGFLGCGGPPVCLRDAADKVPGHPRPHSASTYCLVSHISTSTHKTRNNGCRELDPAELQRGEQPEECQGGPNTWRAVCSPVKHKGLCFLGTHCVQRLVSCPLGLSRKPYVLWDSRCVPNTPPGATPAPASWMRRLRL